MGVNKWINVSEQLTARGEYERMCMTYPDMKTWV